MGKKADEHNVNTGINDHSLNEEQKYSDNITSTILQNLQEGVFFLNPKYEIEKYYSSSLEQILGVKNLKNKNFITLLENRIPEQIVINAREYLELMFKNDLDEEVINELNPLIETEFFFEDEWGIWKSSKYLSFNFKRVIEDNKVISLMATILDDSDKIILDEKLKQTEEHTQKQMEWLVNI